ncbi:tRNA (N6-threonylcarbamoyladenosine(37)-N6)-methyltransferase TrmO [Rhodovulum sulfidophilum]|uniref:SAM-dependent methyltransferase n=1 Tax=Rhodovulum visakhapatnamense TaxID=364297 RepID=A0ABS1REL0_9RHOB|nr:SAM-dependent methyltransferase [Rhodovulum visakhapatnamense]MBL3570471.1 SAM-dependent methyltransferase [Rhodovulum visakhapatnamense]MBL3578048.1 SAM-dependent methyltransferase [Rhodovulum visakhapatnamense]OLS44558.1 tRNA (N6-threonylcarbamoyladenosine(37)-N6)-methyltransferase TrmO [Rhodovulum sulfidophilum]
MEKVMAEIRAGEVCAPLPQTGDATVWFVGRLRTPWTSPRDCPRQGDRTAGPVCRIEIDPRWREALAGIERKENLLLLYWMDGARRDLVRQSPHNDGETIGTFALRSPNRPNPVACSVVALLGREGDVLLVRGLDCIDGTPLIDLKPDYGGRPCPEH